MESLKYSLSELPVWHGVSNKHRPIVKKPFVISLEDSGYIKQVSEPEQGEFLVTEYEDDGYNWITPPPGASEWANRLGDIYFDYFAEKVGKVIEGKNIIEIGAGSLYISNKIIDTFSINSYLIVDPGIRHTANRDQIKIVKEYYNDDLNLEDKIDICICLNALEHVFNPGEIVKKLSVDLSENGEAVLVFPGIEKQFKNGDFNALLHEHVNYFTKESCDQIFTKSGFDILDFDEREDTYYYHLRKNNTTPSEESFNLEYTGNLFSESIEIFEKNLAFFSEQVGNLLKEDKKIIFHGATNGLNNLLGICGFDNHANIEVIDGDVYKHGKFISANNKEIKGPQSYKTLDFDVVIISAMSFYEPIQKALVEDFNIDSNKIKTIYPLS